LLLYQIVKKMLSNLTTELTGMLLTLERYQVVDHFDLSIAVSRLPLAPAIASLLSVLLSAVEDCHARLKALSVERPFRTVSSFVRLNCV